MLFNKKAILLVLALFASGLALRAQVVSPAMIFSGQKELAAKGISEDQLKAKLAEKGVNVANVKPEDLPGLKSTIEEAVKELEAENAAKPAGAVKDTKLTGDKDAGVTKRKDVTALDTKKESKDSTQNAKEAKKESIKPEKDSTAIYGHSLFTDKTLDFYQTTQIANTPDYYVLDVGDKININIFGTSQADLIYQIEEDGFIRPTGMYKIYLKGVSLAKAKELLYKRFQQSYIFNKGQFNLEVTTARTITVNIFGAVQNPGSYTISSLNNALHAILAAGGPTKNGSVRAIRVLNGSKEYTIDVYEFLTNPKKAEGYGLQNNSVIFIPPIQNLVHLTGPFTHTGNFELLPKENIADLLKIAGGVRKNTVLANYNIIRNNGLQENLFTYDYQLTKKMVLEDLDRVVFKATEKEYQNYVSITGAVRFGGQYEFSQSLSIADLLTKANLEEFARTDVAYLTRKNIDGTYQLLSLNLNADNSTFKLQKEDGIVIFDQRTFVTKYTFSVTGAVRQPVDSHFLDPNKTIRFSDAILLAGGVQDQGTEFAYITGRDKNSGKKVSYQVVNIAEALANPGSSADVIIQAYDQITIPSVEDFQEELFVEVRGAVKNPKKMVYDASLTLTDLLLKAGGLTIDAASNKVDIFRLLIQDNIPTEVLINSVSIDRALDPKGIGAITLEPFDIVVVRKVPDFELIRTVTVEGEVKYPGEYPITKNRETLAEIIAKAGGVTNEAFLINSSITRSNNNVGRITIDFKKALKRKRNRNHNIVVQENDSIVIGKKQDIVLVGISGTNAQEFIDTTALSNGGKIATPYFVGRRAGFYIQEYAGGFDKDAKRSKTYVKDLDGRLKKTHNFLLFRVHRKVNNGSEIVISSKKANRKEERKNRKEAESKVNIKDTVTELLSLMISAFTVITLANKL
jgi:protein involved in polysaccharide export with SLBB domain